MPGYPADASIAQNILDYAGKGAAVKPQRWALPKILSIDDDELDAFPIERMLASADYEVIRAEEGAAGLQLLKTHRIDLVLTDIIMPGMEGIETIREFREIDPDLPIIAMSGGGLTAGADYLRMAEALGANAILAKPFDREELLAIVESCLKI